MKLNEKKLSLKFRAKTFYFASLFLPKQIRSEIESLYIFCRLIDDLGDENKFKKKKILENLLKIKKEIKINFSSDNKINDFIKIMQKYKIEKNLPLELIYGVRGDLKNVNFSDIKELIEYSFRVAGTVGYMFCKIIGVKEKKHIFRGVQLGIAMQFTNIARDVEEDLKRKRIYIPKSMRNYKKADYSKILKNEEIKKQFSISLKELLDKADQIYNNAWEGIYKLPLRFRLPIGIAAELYQQIGKKIKKKKYNIWKQRVYLTKLEKLFFFIKVIIRVLNTKRIEINHDIDNQIIRSIKNTDIRFYE